MIFALELIGILGFLYCLGARRVGMLIGFIVCALLLTWLNNNVFELLPLGIAESQKRAPISSFHLMETLSDCQQQTGADLPSPVSLERFSRLDRGPFQLYLARGNSSTYLLEFKHQWFAWRLWRITEWWNVYPNNKMEPMPAEDEHHPRYLIDMVDSGQADPRDLEGVRPPIYGDTPIGKQEFFLQPGDPEYQNKPDEH